MLTPVPGKSLEQIDELFGDISRKHDLERKADAGSEKDGFEVVEVAK